MKRHKTVELSLHHYLGVPKMRFIKSPDTYKLGGVIKPDELVRVKFEGHVRRP